MSAAPRSRRATYDDLLAAPDTMVAAILDGELVTSPRPRGPHAVAHTSIIGLPHQPFHRGAGGPGTNSPEVLGRKRADGASPRAHWQDK